LFAGKSCRRKKEEDMRDRGEELLTGKSSNDAVGLAMNPNVAIA